MKIKRSFKQFTSEIEKISKSEKGKLKGGFNSMSLPEQTDPPVTNNGKICHCEDK